MRIDPQVARGTRNPEERFPRTPISQVRIGNDVVDLHHPACRGREPGDPFAARILAGSEMAWLEDAPDDREWGLRLWALWAAKESAFKALEKGGSPSRVFRPRSLVCHLDLEPLEAEGLGGGRLTRFRGVVESGSPPYLPEGGEGGKRHPEGYGCVAVDGSSDGSWLHMIGWSGGHSRPGSWRLDAGVEGTPGRMGEVALEDLRTGFSEEEWEGVHSIASARVRILARARLEAAFASLRGGETGGDPGASRTIEILTSGERPGRTPPRIRVAGRNRADMDLSLSHHGRFVAWALLLPPLPGR